jgi:hypothetical protein
MATLVSPGVSVSVIDESFYGSAGSGTVPLIVFATGANKAHPSGTGTATGTTATSSEVKLITSQRELIQTYGNPSFRSVSGTQIHADNQNEYGLLAAHSYLGIANRAYMLRANLDLSQLVASSTAPAGAPVNGTHWLDLTTSTMGVFSYNAGTATWVAQSVSKLNATTDVDAGTGAPLNSYGLDGDFAWTSVKGGNAHNRIWSKVSGVWYHLGTDTWRTAASKDFQFAAHTAVPTIKSTEGGGGALATGDVWIKTTEFNNGTKFAVKSYDSATKKWTTITSPVLADTTAAWTHFTTPVAGNLFVQYNHEQGAHTLKVASHKVRRFNGSATLAVTGSTANPTLTATHTVVINGTTVTYSTSADAAVIRMAALVNSAAITNITASVASNKLVITNTTGKDVILAAGSGTLLADLGLTAGTSTNWPDLSYEPNLSTPTGATPNGTLWYDSNITTVDLLETYDNGGTTAWRTFSGTLTAAASKPTTPASGDVHIDTTDTENYPKMYNYNGTTTTWDLIDKSDQTTGEGIVFGDFRATIAGSLDSNAPVPATYPIGMLGWNFMVSGYNVKKYNSTSAKWVNESGLRIDGSPYMGRHATKKVIVRALAAAINSDQDIRAETRFFNLIACPGFPELIDEMKTLHVDRKEQTFVICDVPFRLASSGSAVQNWATNAANAAENGEDALISSGYELGVWYPGGCYVSNTDGKNVVQPASHIMLRQIAYNDQVAYQWFAPAGYQRGIVQNATSVGYINAEDEYVPVTLNQGQRDVLYTNKVNPIAFMPNRGLTVFGQKTLYPLTSALDRINVSRLVAFLRKQFDDMAQPFLFEPNDSYTRDQVIEVFNGFMGDLITKRALYDFLVVCDDSNNTPTRIDRNELWIDVAIQPVKAIEFIYIPVRIKNTGESMTT